MSYYSNLNLAQIQYSRSDIQSANTSILAALSSTS
jgi:hypothetical protein